MEALLYLLIASMAALSHAHYHVLVADGSQQDDGGSSISISSHLIRHRRSLTHRDEILATLEDEEELGSGVEDISTANIQEFQFFMKNNDTTNPARTTISELMPGNAVLMDFTIHNEGKTYRYDRHSRMSVEEATVEYRDSVSKGLSAVMLGDVDRCSDCRTDELDPDQAVAATVNIAPGDTLSVSLSYMIPAVDTDNTKIAETEKETYRTDVTIDLDESARNFIGVLMSPNYPDNYPNSADLTWLIDAPIYDMVIAANMISFDTEACCDHLYIYDGPTDTYPLLYVGSGDITGPESLVTTRSSMFVKFQTDSLVNDGGFALEFHPTTREIITEDDQTDEEKHNNGTVIMLDDSGTLKSPNYPDFYPANSRIVWDIAVETGYTIDFRIIDFDVFEGETLQVIDRNTSKVYASLNYLSYLTILPYYFNVSSNQVSVVFNTIDKIIPKRGLYGKYFARRADEIFLEQNDTSWHAITSPHYPHHYGNNDYQVWIITARDVASVIRMAVTSLNLEEGFDFLYIYNGASIDRDEILATLSGMGGDDIEYMSDGNTATIVFDSDKSITDKGFELTYRNDRAYTNCSETAEFINGGPGGTVRNVNYPSNVVISHDCQWLLRVDESKKVAATLREFEETYAQISFYDGSSKLDRLLWSTTGDSRNGISVASSSNEMLVIISPTSSGYNARYWYSFQEIDGENIPYCEYRSLHTVAPGQITNVNYPNYALYEECSWIIEAPLGYQVKATFQQIVTSSSSSSSYRMLDFYDGSSTDSPLIASCSNYYCPVGSSVSSSSTNLLIVADVSSTLRFKLQYQFESGLNCYINREIGSVMSPSFPNAYPNSFYQVTFIEVASGSIMFYFDAFATESCCDLLSLYDGSSTSSPLIYTLGGDQQGLSGQTSGRYLTLQFSTNDNDAGSGFRMDYCSTSQECGFLGNKNSAYAYLLQPYRGHRYYIGSPDFSEYYPDNVDFFWYIECYEEDDTSRYTFKRVDIDKSDSLILYQGFNMANVRLNWKNGYFNYAGSDYTIDIYDRRSILWFHSDTAFSGLGFFVSNFCH